MKTNNLITRFLDGLTSPEEERQLRDVLEAQTSLSEEERAVHDLLRLSFPEEDTAALLTEDLSADFEDMTAQTDRSKNTKRSPFFTVHSSLFIRRFTAVLSIAAILLIAFLLWPAKQETSITQPESQPVIAEVNPQPVPQPIVEEKKDVVLAEAQPTPQPVREQRKAVKKQSAPIEEPVLAQAEPMIPAEATSQPQVDVQPFHEARVSSMDVGNDVVDPKMLLYTAEIELEKNTHQRQEASEKEMMQHELELLLYIITNKEDKLADGTVNTQKS